MKTPFFTIWLTILITGSISISGLAGQQLLQLEIYNEPVAIKYGPGSILHYQIKGSDTWYRGKIERVDYENQIIVFTNAYEHLESITRVKRYKEWARQLGLRLMQFSAAWFLYGGISELINDDFALGWDTLGIGGGAFVTGFAMYKLASTKTYNVKGKDRLRIIDIGWPDPVGKK